MRNSLPRNIVADRRGKLYVSDRDFRLRALAYGFMLNGDGLVGPMGGAGAAGDNAPMESFFVLLQKNVLDRHAGSAGSLWMTCTIR